MCGQQRFSPSYRLQWIYKTLLISPSFLPPSLPPAHAKEGNATFSWLSPWFGFLPIASLMFQGIIYPPGLLLDLRRVFGSRNVKPLDFSSKNTLWELLCTPSLLPGESRQLWFKSLAPLRIMVKMRSFRGRTGQYSIIYSLNNLNPPYRIFLPALLQCTRVKDECCQPLDRGGRVPAPASSRDSSGRYQLWWSSAYPVTWLLFSEWRRWNQLDWDRNSDCIY